MIRFTTLNSTYELDHDAREWRRTQNNGVQDASFPLRTDKGVLWAHGEIVVGEPARLVGPTAVSPDLDSGFARLVETSSVISVEGDGSEWIPRGTPPVVGGLARPSRSWREAF